MDVNYTQEVPYDTIYYNGCIYTMGDILADVDAGKEPQQVEVVATKDGKITFTGLLDAVKRGAGPDTRFVDLGGKVMLPGFIDPHGHFPDPGYYDLYRVNLRSRPMGVVCNFTDMATALRARVAVTPEGEWIVGYGYDHNKLDEKENPDRFFLDSISDKHPIFISHACHNVAVANTLALRKASIGKGTERAAINGVVLDADGDPTGLLMTKSAQGFVEPNLAADMFRVMDFASDICARVGITTADNAGTECIYRDCLEALKQKTMRVRLVYNPPGRVLSTKQADGSWSIRDTGIDSRKLLGWTDPENIETARPPESMGSGVDITNLLTAKDENPLPANRILHGRWKMQYDGSPQGRTSFNKRPGQYAPDPAFLPDDADRDGGNPYYSGKSVLNMRQEDMDRWVSFYHNRGQSLEVHGNGDKGIEHIIASFEKAAAAPESANVVDMRHAVIHCQFMERQHFERQQGIYYATEGELPEDLIDRYGGRDCLEGVYYNGTIDSGLINALDGGEKMRCQNFTNTFFVNHIYFWGKEHRDIYLGPGRAHQMSPTGWAVHYGQRFTLHTDSPVVPLEPLRCVQTAVLRLTADEEYVNGSSRNTGATKTYPTQDPTNNWDAAARTYWDYDLRVGVHRALRGITVDAAYQKHLDHLIGSLEPGKLADFVLLDQDPFAVAPDRIASINVLRTIVGDTTIYDGEEA